MRAKLVGRKTPLPGAAGPGAAAPGVLDYQHKDKRSCGDKGGTL